MGSLPRTRYPTMRRGMPWDGESHSQESHSQESLFTVALYTSQLTRESVFFVGPTFFLLGIVYQSTYSRKSAQQKKQARRS
jgi:hypothetical protein